jgi:hypothetical protein
MLPERGFCEGHIKLCEDIAVIKTTLLNLDKRINGSMDNFAKHIEESSQFRTMATKHDVQIKSFKGTKALIVSVLVTVLLASGGVVFAGGKYVKQLETDSQRINVLDDLHRVSKQL